MRISFFKTVEQVEIFKPIANIVADLTIGIVQTPDDFCNRTNEQKDLLKHARNGSSVVLCSPRRYGKSSLVHVVLERLKKEGFVTAYVDLFPVSSEQDFVARLANAVFKNIGKGTNPKTFI